MMTKSLCIVFAIALVGCSKTSDEVVEETPTMKPAPLAEQPPPPRQGATPRVDPPPASGPSDLPKECLAYKDVVDQLATCEKLGAQRDVLKSQFATSWKAYGDLPPDARRELGGKCSKAARDLKAAVAATCGW